MRESAISCNGYYGCRAAAITTTDGYIDCSAMLSCHDAHGITTQGNLYCSAYKTCYRTNDDYQFDVQGFIQCSAANACDHSERNGNMNAGISVYCGGMEACVQINAINAESTVHCLGQKSCTRSSINAGDSIYCNGNSGCDKSELVASTVSCNGKDSCIESIINADTVNLHGAYSGVQSHIYASNVNVYGVQSFHEGIIDSQDQETLNVQLFGETAGNGGKVICRAGSTCTVVCKATACNDLQYQCETGANCLVEPSACFPETTATIDGVHCPEMTTTATKVHSTIRSMRKFQFKTENDWRRRLKRTADDSVECLDERECESKEYTDVAVKCGGFESCFTSVIHAGETGKDISCYGGRSCFEADLETRDGSINCYGSKACYHGDIRGKHMNCFGEQSCADIKCDTNPCDGAGRITSVDDMMCSGTNACTGSKIKSMANLECSANRACYDSRIDARFDVACDAHYACSKSAIVANHELSCNGMGSCMETELDITKIVTIYGYFGAVYAKISAKEIHAFGYFSAAFTTIDSKDRSQIDVHFFGHLSGFGASVICRAGSVCNLVCKTTGCTNVDFVCLEGAECTVLPKQCITSDKEIVDDILCPNLVTDMTESDDLSALKEQRMADMKENAQWKQVLIEMKRNDDEFDLLQEQSDMDLLMIKADDTGFNADRMLGYDASKAVKGKRTVYGSISILLTVVGFGLCWFYNHGRGKATQYQQIM